MTGMMHAFVDAAVVPQWIQCTELESVVNSRARSTALVNNGIVTYSVAAAAVR